MAVGRPAVLLTCAHVAVEADVFVVLDVDGHRLGQVNREAFLLNQDLDLAVATVDWTIVPEPAAIQLTLPAATATWSGFPYETLGVHGVIAGEGRVVARTRVEIHARTVPALQLLGSPPLSPGMSGGPLVDKASGAVAGLCAAEFSELVGGVVARAPGFAGFGLPLPAGADGLAGRLSAAEAAVSRFGSDPNLEGAKVLVREVNARAEAFAEQKLDYAPKRIVGRGQLQEAVTTFLGGDKVLMPVVGDSGVGKTTFLQSLMRSTGLPCVLVRCADFEPGSDIDAILAIALQLNRPRAPATETASFSAVARAIGPGFLLLDGLNELPAEVDWEGSFLGRMLVELLRSIGWKAIATMRPESWEELEATFILEALHLVAPHGSEGDDRISKPVPTRLGDFSPQEADAYLTAGAAPKSLLRTGMRNPLTLSLALQRGEGAGDLGLDDLLGLQLDESVRRIAGRRGGPRRAIIRGLCADLARKLLTAGRAEISLGDIPTDLTVEFEGLVAETVLIPAGPTRWRFRYDQMLEHLQAEAIADPARVMADPDLRDERLDIPVPASVLAAAVRRQSAHTDRDALHRSLATASKRTDDLFAVVLRGAVLRDEDLTAVTSALETLADPESFHDDMFIGGFSAPPWRSRSVTFAILRAFVLAEEGYGWRVKDVANGTYVAMNANILEMSGVDTLLVGELEADRLGTLAVLQTWLGDPTPMRGSEGTLASWTLNVIDILKAHIGEIAALELALTAPGADRADALMTALAREAGYGLSALEGLTGRPVLPPRRLLRGIEIVLASVEEAGGADESTIRRLDGLLSQPYREPDLEGWRLRLLAQLPGRADGAWTTYHAEVEAGRGNLGPMGVFLTQRPGEAFTLLEQHWRALGDADDVASIVCLTCPRLTGLTDPAILAAWRRRLKFIETLIPDHGPHFAFHVERLFYRMDLDAAKATGLVELTLAAVHGCNETFATNLRYPLCGRGADSFAEREALERHFCRELVLKGPPHAAVAILKGLEETVAKASLFRSSEPLPGRFHDFVEEIRGLVRDRSDGPKA